MHDRVSWASGRAVIHDQTVGPRHDPYHRTVVDLCLKDRKYSLYSCSLAGDWIEGPGTTKLAQAPLWSTKEEREDFCKKVELLTGYEPYFWLDDLWVRVRAHRNDDYYDFDGIYM